MLNMATCKCEGGDEPWTGHLHDTCPLDQSDCQHNAKLNKETCDCEFCRYPWNGGVPTYAAGDVMRVHWGPHQGKKVTYVGRSQTNGAKVVVKLNGKDIEIDVNYVKYDDANRLKNAMAGHLAGGSTCSVCNRKVGDCLHGSASVDLATCKCICPEPMVWDGEQCQTCTVDKRDCKFGSFFEKSLCKCKRCGKNFGGSSPGKCNQCAHKDDWCKNGGEMDPKTCTCKCKAGWNGDDCSEASCPVGANGKVCSGQGTCKNVNGWAYCHCHANHANADCSGSRSSGHCHTVGDPHPYNFDRLRFDWYNDGEVVLYKNTKNWEDDQMSAISTRYHSVAGNTGFAWRRRGRDGFHGHIKFMQPSRHSSCSAVHYCNNKNVCKRLSSNDCYSSRSWKELPNGLKFRFNGGGYEVQSLDGFQRVNWNSWWGPPKNRLNIYININEEKNSADGICGRHNPSNPLNPGHRWRNNIGLNSRNNGVWYRSYTPQQSQCKYPSLFDSGGSCPFSVNNGNFGNADASCGATGIPASEGTFEPSPFRFQQLGMKADGDNDNGNDAAAASKDESNPLSDLEKCPRAKLEAAPIEGGVCYTACKEEKNSEMQQGSQCWNCLNDWCTSGDASVGAAAAGAVEDTKKAVADNVKEEDALIAVDNEQAAEDAIDQERANAAAAMQ